MNLLIHFKKQFAFDSPAQSQISTGCGPNPLAIPLRVMLPFLKCLVARDELGRVGGRCPFHGLSAGETAGPALAGQCGVPPHLAGRR